jgi:hypothetical protein
MSQARNQNQSQRAKSRRYVEYEDLGKEELIRLLKIVHARVKRVERDIEDLRALLLYGSTGGRRTKATRAGKAKPESKQVEDVPEDLGDE